MTKKIKCPYCGSERIAEYLYGLYGDDDELIKAAENGKVIFAGCIITIPNQDPDYRCRDCGKDFGGNLKKMKVSEDKVLEFAKECGFEDINYLGAWNGNHVYDAIIEKYPNPFRIHCIGHPPYILVNGDICKYYTDEHLEITDHFFSDEDEEDDEQMTETGLHLLNLLKGISQDNSFFCNTIGRFTSDEQMQDLIDVIESGVANETDMLEFIAREISQGKWHNELKHDKEPI